MRREDNPATVLKLTAILAGLIVLPAMGHAAGTDAVAYPNAPGGTPAANDGGKPVAPAGSVCATPGCPDVPGAPKGSAANDTGTDQKPGVRTPATAYPGNPQGIPSTAPNGSAAK